MFRLFALVAALGALFIGAMQLSAGAGAAGWARYDAAEFMMAQKKGKVIVVDVHADRCPPCRAQAPILEELRVEHQSTGVLFVKVDYDTEPAFVREHRLARGASVLVFRGMDETARTREPGDRAALRDAVLRAL